MVAGDALNARIRANISVFGDIYCDVGSFDYFAHDILPEEDDDAWEFITNGGAREIQVIRTPTDKCADCEENATGIPRRKRRVTVSESQGRASTRLKDSD